MGKVRFVWFLSEYCFKLVFNDILLCLLNIFCIFRLNSWRINDEEIKKEKKIFLMINIMFLTCFVF